MHGKILDYGELTVIDLFEHNRIAYESAITMLEETGKAAIVHPTGTGKSFIGFQLCEDNPDKKICWLSPSEYIFKTQLENLKVASNGYEPKNIKFFTYAKLMNLSEKELSEVVPDFIILDEFHRCGAEFWGQGVQNLLNQYPEIPILGLSATAIRYLDNQRDMSDELFDGNIASEMTLGEAIVRGILNPPKYVLSVFSYQKDFERYQRRVQNTQSRIVRDAAAQYLEALRRALEKADGLDVIFNKHITDRTGKYIIFCSTKEHMDEMIEHVPKWFGKIDDSPNVYTAYSSDPETSKAFADFKADSSEHLKLLFCIDMLNEGVHVDDVSGVILFRPTVSPIVYKQQIGRAMSASKKRDAIIFDIVNNISNLYSIGSIQEEITETIEHFRMNGDNESIVNETFTVIDEVRDCIKLFDELENVLVASWDYMYLEAKRYYEENGDLIVPSKYVTPSGYHLGWWIVSQRGIYNGKSEGYLTAEQIEKLNKIGMCWLVAHERMWEEQYANAKKHFETTGKLLPPFKTDSLAHWVINQRAKYNNGSLDKEKIARLDAIGMVWDLDEEWEKMFRLAEHFYQEHGNLDIPATYVTKNGEKLGRWYRCRVTEFRKGLLSEDRKNRLLSIGFNQESIKVRIWMRYYVEAEKYNKEHGDLHVHANYVTESGLNLGIWISSQRYAYGLGKLPKQRIELLDAIGMDWQRFDGKWMIGFTHLEEYLETFGNLNVISTYISPDGFKLGAWVFSQRNRKMLGKLAKDKIEKLESLSFVWSVTDTAWENAFVALCAYKEKFGNMDVPADYITEQGIKLRMWISNQRTKFRKGKLSKQQIEQLENIGFSWIVQKDNWEAMFACAKKYYETYGNLNVPKDYISDTGINLNSWIISQRKNIKAGKLPQEIAERLYEIGFVFDPSDEAWNMGYSYAEAFYKTHGNLEMSDVYQTDDGFKLGEWIRSQRRAYAKGNYRQTRKDKLDKLSMTWEKPSKKDILLTFSTPYTGFGGGSCPPISAAPKIIR